MQAFVLGISGRMGAGKTTLAGMLMHAWWHQYRRHTLVCNFADALKQEAIRRHGLSFHEVYGSTKARAKLQEIGHNTRRYAGADYWINKAFATLAIYSALPQQNIILADVRYPNEVDTIHAHGGYVLRLTRDPVHDMHPSETALDITQYDWRAFDAILDNAHLSLQATRDLALQQIAPWLHAHIEKGVSCNTRMV